MQCKPKKRLKDALKANSKESRIFHTSLEKLVVDRVAWSTRVWKQVKEFEEGRVEHAVLKRKVRKNQLEGDEMQHSANAMLNLQRI